MEENKWYHIVMTYNNETKEVQAFVNEKQIAMEAGEELVQLDNLRYSYMWHCGCRIGGAHIDRTLPVVAHSVALFNIYSSSAEIFDAQEMYDYSARDFVEGKPTPSPITPSPLPQTAAKETEEVTQEPKSTTVEVADIQNVDTPSKLPLILGMIGGIVLIEAVLIVRLVIVKKKNHV